MTHESKGWTGPTSSPQNRTQSNQTPTNQTKPNRFVSSFLLSFSCSKRKLPSFISHWVRVSILHSALPLSPHLRRSSPVPHSIAMPSLFPFPTLALSFALLLSVTTLASSSVPHLATEDADPCPALSDGSGSGSSCPVNCFRPDPVCGVNGVTYWCGCPEAACAGVQVAKKGFCEVTAGGGSGPVSGQALLLVHIVWLFVLGFAVLFGFF